MTYTAPIADMAFALREVAGVDDLLRAGGHEPDILDAVLEEAGRFAGGVLAPLNRTGDLEGSRLENGVVRTPAGWADAYKGFVAGGWNAVAFDPEWGGQGLPWAVGIAAQEMWTSANMAFALCPLLTQGAVEALAAHGSDALKRLYLAKLVSGEWAGTMNLTEPHAGSDVGALKTRAERDGETYRIRGQKIFITYGEHELAENIVHLVLARLPEAPLGTRGISLFLVPKFIPDAGGRPGRRNDVRCVSLEHKLGIHASPTAVLAYGDADGAVGWLVGEENRGMACMFTMMNNARLAVGMQGQAIAERATQQAVAYARSRVQGGGPIIRHPDVRRMLMTMRASTEATRALNYLAVAAGDRARLAESAEDRARAQRRVDLLTPVVKAWGTDTGCAVASLGVQVHGGMGFIEETGAAQHFRDARIAPIYEGTNGIQAMDLVGRKVARDEGLAMGELVADMRATAAALAAARADDLAAIGRRLADGVAALEAATRWIVETAPGDPAAVGAAAAPYLRMAGLVAGGWTMGTAALAAAAGNGSADPAFRAAKRTTARFYADNILPEAASLLAPVTEGGPSVLALDDAAF